MAQLKALNVHQPSSTPRISQLLPTVKCSSCCQPVTLDDLGDHVCPPTPTPNPQLSHPMDTKSMLPTRLQNFISNKAAIPLQPQLPQRPPQTPPPPRQPQWSATRPSPERDPFQRLPSVQGGPLSPGRMKSPAPLLKPAFNPPRLGSPSSDRPYPPSSPAPRPSVDRSYPPPSLAPRPSVDRPYPPPGPAPRPPFDRPYPPPSPAPRPPFDRPYLPPSPSPRLPFDKTSPPPNPAPRPSFDRVHTTPSPAPRPPFDKAHTPPSPAPRPSFDKAHTPPNPAPRPSLDKAYTPPSPAPRPSFERPHMTSSTLPAPQNIPKALTEKVQRPARQGSYVPFPSSMPSSIPPHAHLPMRSPIPQIESGIDTKIGGEAGMAGVGRRGFAAAARAAMVASSFSHRGPHDPSAPQPNVGMDGRRLNAPKYLDINAVMNNVHHAATTPPLSPHSVHSPLSPYPASPISPPGAATPTAGYGNTYKLPLHNPHESVETVRDLLVTFPGSSPSRVASPLTNPFTRRVSGETEMPSTPGLPMHLPFLDREGKDRDGDGASNDGTESIYTSRTSERRHTRNGVDDDPTSPSGSDLGLAYEDPDDVPVVLPLAVRKPSISEQVKFPSVEGRSNSVVSASVLSQYSHSRSTTKSSGALERAMESLIEDGASVSILASGSVLASLSSGQHTMVPETPKTGMVGNRSSLGKGKSHRSNTVPGPGSPDAKPPKMPTRSHTSPSHPVASSEERPRRTGGKSDCGTLRKDKGVKTSVKRQRACARCDKKIEDGRWIQMDGGSVLCEKCWKNMYLPKCRRCNLPIEKQAVSSSDGQLKGKYHRHCFNCHICQKPFPDKEFYVFDGKPLCAYHYHEANDSLCAAPSCGDPIEGPCAVAHSGRRFHPEHFLCEERGCRERLIEYWEVDGQMLCERHVLGGYRETFSSGEVAGSAARDEGRAMKRMTRFIDLGAVEDVEEDEIDLR